MGQLLSFNNVRIVSSPASGAYSATLLRGLTSPAGYDGKYYLRQVFCQERQNFLHRYNADGQDRNDALIVLPPYFYFVVNYRATLSTTADTYLCYK